MGGGGFLNWVCLTKSLVKIIIKGVDHGVEYTPLIDDLLMFPEVCSAIPTTIFCECRSLPRILGKKRGVADKLHPLLPEFVLGQNACAKTARFRNDVERRFG